MFRRTVGLDSCWSFRPGIFLSASAHSTRQEARGRLLSMNLGISPAAPQHLCHLCPPTATCSCPRRTNSTCADATYAEMTQGRRLDSRWRSLVLTTHMRLSPPPKGKEGAGKRQCFLEKAGFYQVAHPTMDTVLFPLAMQRHPMGHCFHPQQSQPWNYATRLLPAPSQH